MDDTSNKKAILGSVCLFVSAMIFVLIFVEQGGGSLPFMPRSWYSNQPLWGLMAVGGLVAAFFLLRSAMDHPNPHQQNGGRCFSASCSTRETIVICATKRGWPSRTVQSELPQIEEVDIDTDPQLVERFGTCVPVVEIDGVVRFRGRVNDVLLRRLIDGSEPQE